MENKYNYNFLKNKEMMNQDKYNYYPKFNFYPNQNYNINKNINFNKEQVNNNKKNNLNNLNINKDVQTRKESNQIKSNLSTNIYEKNILLLNEKIKEQENDILYLNDRLKNYDATVDEVTRLNLEINKLNEIIREKDYTIKEYRDITELSKKKFDELIKNKNNLMQRIKFLEKENQELKNNINNFDNNFTDMKLDLNDIIKQNRELKRELYEKNIKLRNMNDFVQKINVNQNNNIDDINYNKIALPENRYIKDTSNILNNINNYIVKNNENNIMKERSRTPIIQNIANEEKYIPNRRFNNLNLKGDYSLRTEPNNNYSNDLKINFRY
jgi:chromosome segregation ATPase